MNTTDIKRTAAFAAVAAAFCAAQFGCQSQADAAPNPKDYFKPDIQYVDGKGWSLRNVGTGKYLKDASPAKYDEPTYFTLCTLAPATSGIQELTEEPVARRQSDVYIYNLQGVRVAKKSDWNSLPRGIYIVNGRKVTR